MSGVIEAGILALAAAGAVTDLLWGRLYNWMNFPGLLLGCAAAAWLGGWAGLTSSLLGVALALAAYGLLFCLRGMAGGDVKFLMALGAWGGWRFTLQVALLAIAVGGVIALGVLLARGQLGAFLRRLRHFVLTIVIKELELEPLRIDWSSTIPFGVAISVAAVWVELGDPFGWLGARI